MKKVLLVIIGLLLILNVTWAQSKYNKANQLNLRKNPVITQTNIITKIPYGAVVTVITAENSWSYIEYKEHKGYVSSKYLVDQLPKQNTKSKEETVIVCNSQSSYAYHRYKCRGLSRCKAGTSRLTVSKAKSARYRACKICY